MMRKNNKAGFTLIELMIVLVIISILLAYAIPSYRQYVLKSHRTEAHNALLLIASLQERYYANNNKYADTLTTLGVNGNYPAPSVANGLFYTIEMAGAATSYTIKATAAAANNQTDDVAACHVFSLDNIGTKLPVGNDCW